MPDKITTFINELCEGLVNNFITYILKEDTDALTLNDLCSQSIISFNEESSIYKKLADLGRVDIIGLIYDKFASEYPEDDFPIHNLSTWPCANELMVSFKARGNSRNGSLLWSLCAIKDLDDQIILDYANSRARRNGQAVNDSKNKYLELFLERETCDFWQTREFNLSEVENESGKSIYEDIFEAKEDGLSPLAFCIMNNKLELVKKILSELPAQRQRKILNEQCKFSGDKLEQFLSGQHVEISYLDYLVLNNLGLYEKCAKTLYAAGQSCPSKMRHALSAKLNNCSTGAYALLSDSSEMVSYIQGIEPSCLGATKAGAEMFAYISQAKVQRLNQKLEIPVEELGFHPGFHQAYLHNHYLLEVKPLSEIKSHTEEVGRIIMALAARMDTQGNESKSDQLKGSNENALIKDLKTIYPEDELKQGILPNNGGLRFAFTELRFTDTNGSICRSFNEAYNDLFDKIKDIKTISQGINELKKEIADLQKIREELEIKEEELKIKKRLGNPAFEKKVEGYITEFEKRKDRGEKNIRFYQLISLESEEVKNILKYFANKQGLKSENIDDVLELFRSIKEHIGQLKASASHDSGQSTQGEAKESQASKYQCSSEVVVAMTDQQKKMRKKEQEMKLCVEQFYKTDLPAFIQKTPRYMFYVEYCENNKILLKDKPVDESAETKENHQAKMRRDDAIRLTLGRFNQQALGASENSIYEVKETTKENLILVEKELGSPLQLDAEQKQQQLESNKDEDAYKLILDIHNHHELNKKTSSSKSDVNHFNEAQLKQMLDNKPIKQDLKVLVLSQAIMQWDEMRFTDDQKETLVNLFLDGAKNVLPPCKNFVNAALFYFDLIRLGKSEDLMACLKKEDQSTLRKLMPDNFEKLSVEDIVRWPYSFNAKGLGKIAMMPKELSLKKYFAQTRDDQGHLNKARTIIKSPTLPHLADDKFEAIYNFLVRDCSSKQRDAIDKVFLESVSTARKLTRINLCKPSTGLVTNLNDIGYGGRLVVIMPPSYKFDFILSKAILNQYRNGIDSSVIRQILDSFENDLRSLRGLFDNPGFHDVLENITEDNLFFKDFKKLVAVAIDKYDLHQSESKQESNLQKTIEKIIHVNHKLLPSISDMPQNAWPHSWDWRQFFCYDLAQIDHKLLNFLVEKYKQNTTGDQSFGVALKNIISFNGISPNSLCGLIENLHLNGRGAIALELMKEFKQDLGASSLDKNRNTYLHILARNNQIDEFIRVMKTVSQVKQNAKNQAPTQMLSVRQLSDFHVQSLFNTYLSKLPEMNNDLSQFIDALKATKNVSLTKLTPNDQANLLGSAFQAGHFSSILYLLSMGIDDCSEVKFEDFYKSKRPPRANVEQYKQFWQVCRKIYWPIAGMRIKKDLKLAIVLSPILGGLTSLIAMSIYPLIVMSILPASLSAIHAISDKRFRQLYISSPPVVKALSSELGQQSVPYLSCETTQSETTPDVLPKP